MLSRRTCTIWKWAFWIAWLCPPAGSQGDPEFVLQAGHRDVVLSVSFSVDGHTVASASLDTTVKIWDVSSGTLLRTLEGHVGGVDFVAFSSAGKILASASRDHTVKIWETTSGKLLRTLEGHTNGVRSVAFSADGQALAS